MPHGPEPMSRLAGLAAADAGQLLLGAIDLVLVLDTERRVCEVQIGWGVSMPGVDAITGQLIDGLLCQSSRSKLPLLLANNGAESDEAPRWRHVNLQTPAGSLPLLMRYYGFRGARGGLHVLVARDLRPTEAMQKQVQQAMIDLERRAEAFHQASQPVARGSGPRGAGLGDPLGQVGQQPLRQIVHETARALERLCAQEALKLTDGDRVQAASVLDIAVDEFERLLATD